MKRPRVPSKAAAGAHLGHFKRKEKKRKAKKRNKIK
jgi:hypothetical protein